ncbi:ABC transporter permease [Vallitalea pronyensis]|uniref:ABC transporter permease n=1 Tax=Vallitalea pronyensis TaxID=1348613 RepID=UPI001FE6DE42|nr:ABC transporter permease subunit [Vallitalea pronyensis]
MKPNQSLAIRNKKKSTNKCKSFFRYLRDKKVLFFMLIPGLAVMLVNSYMPMFGIVLAFKNLDNYGNIFGGKWIWFDNFKYLFGSSQAYYITRNTLLYNIVFILIGSTIAVILAIALSEILNRKLAKFYQSVFFLPYFLSWVVVSYLVFSILSSDMGALNNLLKSLGLEPINWYVSPKFWPGILISVNTWKWTGYDCVIYLAAIVGIDKSYYEAAAVDGASRFQQIRKVTIPMLVPLVIILTLMKIGRIFYTDMGLFYTVPRNMGILYKATSTIDTYVYRALSQTGDLGMAAAAGFYQAVLGFILVMTFNTIVRRIDKESALF